MNTDSQILSRLTEPKPAAAAARLMMGRRTRSLRIPAAVLPSRPILTGDREWLRALRAAEQAAWEAALPATAPTATARADSRHSRVSSPPAKQRPGAGSLLLIVLAVCTTVALVSGRLDPTNLQHGWTQFAEAIRTLLS